VSLGGSPLRRGSTGRGVALALAQFYGARGWDLTDATVAIQGFGKVGRAAAFHIAERGARVVAVSDLWGTLHCEAGLDPTALIEQIDSGAEARDGRGTRMLPSDAIFDVRADVLVPAAMSCAIDTSVAERLRARTVVEAANVPLTATADEVLERRGISVVPDVAANIGGVVASYFEWIQNHAHERWPARRSLEAFDSTVGGALQHVARRAEETRTSWRRAAYSIALERVIDAMSSRGLYF
jgi:glutamate dehydrogenase/leucine dehydrogenase